MPEVQEYRSGPQGTIDLASLNNLGVRSSPEPESSPSESSEESKPSPRPDLPTRPEPAKEPEEIGQEKSEEGAEEPAEAKENGKHKPLSRYEKTKRRLAQVKEREAALEARERQLAAVEQQRQEAERKAQEPDYTIGDLKKYKAQWEREGNYDLVSKADAEIERLEKLEQDKLAVVQVPRPGTKEFTDTWHKAEKELYDHDVEFMRQGTRLDTTLRQIMSGPDGELFRSHPYGIYAAYNQAKLALTTQDLEHERTKTRAYEKEIQRLNGLLGIGGGAPARGSGPFEIRDFQKLSTKDMRRHLLASADS